MFVSGYRISFAWPRFLFQATTLDVHVVIVVGPECLWSILKDYFSIPAPLFFFLSE